MAYTSWSVIAGETPTATKWNLLGGNDADFDSRLTQLIADSTVATLADASTLTFNMSTRRLWHSQISGNRTIVFSNIGNKRPFTVLIQQDGTGGRTVNWPEGIEWPGGVEPALSTEPNATDLFTFIPKPDFVQSSNEVYWGIYGAFGLVAPEEE